MDHNIDELDCTVSVGSRTVTVSGWTTKPNYMSNFFVLDVIAENQSSSGASGNFIVRTYYGGDSSKIMAEDATCGTITLVAASPRAVIKDVATYYDPEQVRQVGSMAGPLIFSLKLGGSTALSKTDGVIEITSDKTMTQPSDTEMRCIWKDTGTKVEYLAKDCSLAANKITMKTPMDHDIAAGTEYEVKVTTINAVTYNGVSFDVGAVDYLLSIVMQNGGTTLFKDEMYTTIASKNFAKLA
ncbi:MAG: hypothetical protein V2I33_17805, partial [Kangiellaceae bacterium]|nr:hypothetical protein [Kangiellaceae bacterium]